MLLLLHMLPLKYLNVVLVGNQVMVKRLNEILIKIAELVSVIFRKNDENSCWLVRYTYVLLLQRDNRYILGLKHPNQYRPKTNVPEIFMAKTETKKTLNQATPCRAERPSKAV